MNCDSAVCALLYSHCKKYIIKQGTTAEITNKQNLRQAVVDNIEVQKYLDSPEGKIPKIHKSPWKEVMFLNTNYYIEVKANKEPEIGKMFIITFSANTVGGNLDTLAVNRRGKFGYYPCSRFAVSSS